MRARRDDPMDAQVTVVAEDVQVAAKPRRRTYTAEYKRRILKEAAACTTPGAVGALLRREGLYTPRTWWSGAVLGGAANWPPWLRSSVGASRPRLIPATGRSPSLSGTWPR